MRFLVPLLDKAVSNQRMQRDEELAISFLQIGNDPGAKNFLKALDDQLQGVGAKFDICDTVTFDELEDLSLAEVLTNAIHDWCQVSGASSNGPTDDQAVGPICECLTRGEGMVLVARAGPEY